MSADMLTPRQLVSRFGIRIGCEWTDSNPHMDPDGNRSMNHWRCTLRRTGEAGSRRQMTVVFSMGYAHTSEPTAEQIIECLASDAAGIENAGSFEEWASEYGYDEDSRSAERTYQATERQTKRLRTFLGETLYDIALWQMQDA